MQFEPVIARLTLIPSHEGRFEVTVDGKRVFSKVALRRLPRPGEVVGLVTPLAAAAEQSLRTGF